MELNGIDKMNTYEFGKDAELDMLRATHNLSKILKGKVTKRKLKVQIFKQLK